MIETENKTIVGDTLLDVKFSGISWDGNKGFYYSSYKKPENSILSEKTDRHKLYYHKLYNDQKHDKVIFGQKEKFRYVSGRVTKDQNYLIISASNETSGNNLYIKDLNTDNSKLIQITYNFESNSYITHNIGTKLYIHTNLNAPNNKLIVVDANDPSLSFNSYKLDFKFNDCMIN